MNLSKALLLFVLLLVAAVVAACGDDSEEATPATPTATAEEIPLASPTADAEEDVREAVFRWQFENNASGLQQAAQVYFLALGSGDQYDDPSTELLERFAENDPPVRPVSLSTADPGAGVVDVETGDIGLIFRIATISWTSDTAADVTGGYYEAGLSASGNTYTVEFVDGEWTVVDDVMHWIS